MQRRIAQITLHGVDGHGLIELTTIAGRLAGMMADPTRHGRQRIGHDQGFPGAFHIAIGQWRHVGLGVLSCGAGPGTGSQAMLVPWGEQIAPAARLEVHGTARQGKAAFGHAPGHQAAPGVMATVPRRTAAAAWLSPGSGWLSSKP
jgi:hypothetical protein